MKKCTSCAKDLPDSALHCVFCGAKQAPAPVPGAAQAQAKTVLGYQAADVMKEVRGAAGRPGPSSQPPMSGMPPAGPLPPPASTQRPGPPVSPSQQAAASAATVFVPGGGGPPGGHGGYGGGINPSPPFPGATPGALVDRNRPGPTPAQSMPTQQIVPAPMGGPMGGPPMGGPPMGAPMPMPSREPSAPLPATVREPSAPMLAPMGRSANPTAPPYLASQSAARAARPVEPFSEALKLVLLSFGILLLGAFATPTQTDPALAFHWNTIIDAPGEAKLPALILVSMGVLALVIALLPLGAVGRGLFAAVIGVSPIAVGLALAGVPEWQELLITVATLGLVAGLLLRAEYREAQLGRLLATIGAVAVIAAYLIPVNDTIPLVAAFEALDAVPGEAKVGVILKLLPLVLAVVSLLVWLPAPGGAGAKVIAWAWIVLPAVALFTGLLVGGNVGDVIKKSPFEALMAWVQGSAAVAFVGYGVASALGKQLE